MAQDGPPAPLELIAAGLSDASSEVVNGVAPPQSDADLSAQHGPCERNLATDSPPERAPVIVHVFTHDPQSDEPSNLPAQANDDGLQDASEPEVDSKQDQAAELEADSQQDQTADPRLEDSHRGDPDKAFNTRPIEDDQAESVAEAAEEDDSSTGSPLLSDRAPHLVDASVQVVIVRTRKTQPSGESAADRDAPANSEALAHPDDDDAQHSEDTDDPDDTQKPGEGLLITAVSPRYWAHPPTRPRDDEATATAANFFLTRGFLPDPSDRAAVLQHIQRQMVSAAVDGDYEKADEYYSASVRYTDQCHIEDARNVRDGRADDLETQLFEARGHLEQIGDSWRKRIQDLKHEFDLRFGWAQREHEQRLARFDEYWKTPDHLRPYTKMSGALIELRQTERKTVLAKIYTTAKVFQKSAKVLQDQETRTAQANAQYDISTKRAAMIQGYRNQVERIRTYMKKLVADLERKKKLEEDGMGIRIAHLRLQLDRLKQKRPRSGLSVRKVSGQSDGPVVGVMSPRTRSQFYQFRMYPVVKKLDVRPYREFSAFRKGGQRLRRGQRERLKPEVEKDEQEEED
jgi:hypothetical protein